MPGVRRIHLIDAYGLSLCGRYQADLRTPEGRYHARRRMTSKVDCRHCRNEYGRRQKRAA